jgi:predicted TIM-barrel fold metal-dependent hydrolase
MVMDGDVHVTDLARWPRREGIGYYHGRPLSAEEVLAEMDGAGVDVANIWQNPAATIYGEDVAENTALLLEANQYVAACAERHPSRFVASGWTDPRACGVRGAIEIAETCVRRWGFVIVKLNPAQNRYPMDSPDVLRVVDAIVELGAVPAFHYGADTPFTPASGLRMIALRHPGRAVIGVHMGGGGAGYLEAEAQYHQSMELGLECENVHYVFSALRDTYIEEAVRRYAKAGALGRLFCGSDAPYGRMRWNYGGYRAMFAGLREEGVIGEAEECGLLGMNLALCLEAWGDVIAGSRVAGLGHELK